MNEFAKISGQWAGETQMATAGRMHKAEQTSVQGLTRKRSDPGANRAGAGDVASGTCAVKPIAD
jgi:hypothetical protein